MAHGSARFRLDGGPLNLATPGTQAVRQRRQMAQAYAEMGDVVYFLRRGDLVKIGHSRNLRNRLHGHGAKPEDLLYLMPGGYETEQAMHERFADDLAEGREVFRMSPALRAFLDEGRGRMGIEPI